MPGIDRLEFPAGTTHEHLERPQGTFDLWVTPGGVVATQIKGFGLAEFADRFTVAANTVLARGQKLHAFHDWEQVSDYDLAVRSSQVAWVKQHRRMIASLNILIATGILSMGVATAGMLLSLVGFTLKAFRERDRFEAALKAELK